MKTIHSSVMQNLSLIDTDTTCGLLKLYPIGITGTASTAHLSSYAAFQYVGITNYRAANICILQSGSFCTPTREIIFRKVSIIREIFQLLPSKHERFIYFSGTFLKDWGELVALMKPSNENVNKST